MPLSGNVSSASRLGFGRAIHHDSEADLQMVDRLPLLPQHPPLAVEEIAAQAGSGE
jgi:hypothetical protein